MWDYLKWLPSIICFGLMFFYNWKSWRELKKNQDDDTYERLWGVATCYSLFI